MFIIEMEAQLASYRRWDLGYNQELHEMVYLFFLFIYSFQP